jgi:hypothetical protein
MSTLEERLAAVERELAQVREEWTVVQQAPLIQARLLNALRETQVDHDRRLGKMERTLDGHTRVLDGHTHLLDEHTRLLVGLGHGQETIVGMLSTLMTRDEHGGET